MKEDKEQRKQKLSNLEEIENPIVRKAMERGKKKFVFNYGDLEPAYSDYPNEYLDTWQKKDKKDKKISGRYSERPAYGETPW